MALKHVTAVCSDRHAKSRALPHLAIRRGPEARRPSRCRRRRCGPRCPCAHLEGRALVELAIDGATQAALNVHEVAAEYALALIDEEQAGDVLRQCLETDRAVLGVGGGCREGDCEKTRMKILHTYVAPVPIRHART